MMKEILRSIHKLEDRFDRRAERFAFFHPCLAYLTMFIGVPVFIFMAVAASTMLLALPVTWICGYL